MRASKISVMAGQLRHIVCASFLMGEYDVRRKFSY
jgi:hypothetical protein